MRASSQSPGRHAPEARSPACLLGLLVQHSLYLTHGTTRASHPCPGHASGAGGLSHVALLSPACVWRPVVSSTSSPCKHAPRLETSKLRGRERRGSLATAYQAHHQEECECVKCHRPAPAPAAAPSAPASVSPQNLTTRNQTSSMEK